MRDLHISLTTLIIASQMPVNCSPNVSSQPLKPKNRPNSRLLSSSPILTLHLILWVLICPGILSILVVEGGEAVQLLVGEQTVLKIGSGKVS